MKTFEVKYPEFFRYQSQYTDTNLEGTKGTTYNYATKDGSFVVRKTPDRTSAVLSNDATGKYVTQDVYTPRKNVLSSKVTVVGKGNHNCSSVQTLLKDGTYSVERSIDGKKVVGFIVKPESRTFIGIKGLLERVVLFVANDKNGCERVKVAPMARKVLAKIRHF